MKLPRRQFLHLAAGAATVPALTRIARAQAYPTRPVRLIVGFAAGGPTDIAARLIGQWLSERLGYSFVVENRPGAASNIATEAVIRAPADGYTLLQATVSNAINASLYERLNFDFVRDTQPVAGLYSGPLIMEVTPAFPANSVSEFITYVRANRGRVNMASAGSGSMPHIAGELFKMMTGTEMVHVPYRGSGPALADLLGGQVQVMFDPVPSSIEHVRSGKLRALGVTGAVRSPELPDIPSIGEFVPGYQVSSWTGVCAPRGAPAEIIDRLNREVNAALSDPVMKGKIADVGRTVLAGSPAEFGKFISDETEKWAKVVKFANIKPE